MRASVLQAQAHFYRGEPVAMLADLDAAAAFLDQQPAGHTKERATLWRLRADAYLRAAKYDEAVAAARRGLAIAEADPSADDKSRLSALLIVAEAEHQARHADAAFDAATRGRALAAAVHRDNPRIRRRNAPVRVQPTRWPTMATSRRPQPPSCRSLPTPNRPSVQTAARSASACSGWPTSRFASAGSMMPSRPPGGP